MKNLFSFLSILTLVLLISSCEKSELILPEQAENFGLSEKVDKATTDLGKSLLHTMVYASSNTSGEIAVYDVTDVSAGVSAKKIMVPHADADGIIYVGNDDAIYQVNRTDNRVDAFSGVSGFVNGEMIMPSASSTSNFMNGREATYGQKRIVVAQDASPANGDQNALVVYRGLPNNIQYARMHTVDINLWGIQIIDDSDLWAIVDNSNMLAVFEQFNRAPEGPISPTSMVMVEGIVRTHGLNYDAENDIMFLTDVGDAGSATDGAIHVIMDFSTKYADAVAGSGMIPASQQIRLSGPMSTLGNPVDITFKDDTNEIFVAERANGGGQFLVFDLPTENGDAAPKYSEAFPGISAVAFGQ